MAQVIEPRVSRPVGEPGRLQDLVKRPCRGAQGEGTALERHEEMIHMPSDMATAVEITV
jgi:hypothetical protein